MGTRATYCFNDPNQKTYVYIHHDGYLEGAATYFYNTLINPSKGNFATQFIRSNPEATITSSHENHADTEFRYDIDNLSKFPKIKALSGKGDNVLFSGFLYEFANQYSRLIKDFYPFKEIDFVYSSLVLNAVLAEKYFLKLVENLSHWENNGLDKGYNWDVYTNDAKKLLKEFPSIQPKAPSFLT
jgi:hypothetical protein